MQERFFFLVPFFVFFLVQLPCLTGGVQLIVANGCKESIWPGILATAGHPTPNGGGFHLRPGDQRFLNLPANWSGRIWGRTNCLFRRGSENGSCETGDCASRRRCNGAGGLPPATVVEMTLGTPESGLHYYDVSLVDGFNLPVSVVPLGRRGGGGCGAAACEADLNEICPAALAVRRKDGKVVGCSTACLATGLSRYCCTGENAAAAKCRPTAYGRVTKVMCPRAYAFPFDEATGLNICTAPRYLLTFCPPT
ncbi:hypothetical protein V2J09_012570 [Rumex salicifolius]